MDQEQALAFADGWVTAWNAHDIAAVLSFFAADVVFTSPVAALLFPDSGGVMRGREALREYWAEGIRRNPALRFELLGVFVGVGTIVIRFRNEAGEDRGEVLTFGGDGLVRTGHGTTFVSR